MTMDRAQLAVDRWALPAGISVLAIVIVVAARLTAAIGHPTPQLHPPPRCAGLLGCGGMESWGLTAAGILVSGVAITVLATYYQGES